MSAVNDEHAPALPPPAAQAPVVPVEPVFETREPEVVPEPPPDGAAKPVAAAAEVCEASASFVAFILKENPSDDVGWHLDLLDKKIPWVSRIIPSEATPLQRYNVGAPPDRQIKEGDYIKQVNKEASSAQAMRSVLKGESKLEVVVQRPHLYTTTVVKNGVSLGLDLMFGPGSSSMLVEEVRDGAVSRCYPDVRRGDRITKVNGQYGNSDLLMQAVKTSEQLEVEFSRCGV